MYIYYIYIYIALFGVVQNGVFSAYTGGHDEVTVRRYIYTYIYVYMYIYIHYIYIYIARIGVVQR